jgi:hypothetical protein
MERVSSEIIEQALARGARWLLERQPRQLLSGLSAISPDTEHFEGT